MKVSVRRGVFETNSSSVHAIVIDTSGNEERDALWYYTGPKLGDYGRSTKLLTTAEDRLSYLWTAVWDLNYYYGDRDEEDFQDYERQLETFRRAKPLCDLDFWKKRLADAWGFEAEDWEAGSKPRFQGLPRFMKGKWEIDYDNLRDNGPFKRFVRLVDEDFRYYEEHFFKHGLWGDRGIDHLDALIPFLEFMRDDDRALHQYIFGEQSLVLVSNDEGGVQTDVPKLRYGEEIMSAIDEEFQHLCEESKVHEFPESQILVYVKGE